MEKRFYQLSKTPIAIAVAKLAARVDDQNKTLNIVGARTRLEQVDEALWQYADFLPHALETPDGLSKILLSQNPQNLDVQFLLDDSDSDQSVELCCLMFQAADHDIVNKRRMDWKTWSQNGEYLTYWAENENGSWEKKSEANAPNSNKQG